MIIEKCGEPPLSVRLKNGQVPLTPAFRGIPPTISGGVCSTSAGHLSYRWFRRSDIVLTDVCAEDHILSVGTGCVVACCYGAYWYAIRTYLNLIGDIRRNV